MKIKNLASRNFKGLDLEKLERSKSSKFTLVVEAEEDAIKVAKASDSLEFKVIIVQEEDQIIGVLSPKQVIENYNEQKGKRYKSLEEALKEIREDPLEIQNNFEHEYLNHIRVKLKYCKKDDCYVEEGEECPTP